MWLQSLFAFIFENTVPWNCYCILINPEEFIAGINHKAMHYMCIRVCISEGFYPADVIPAKTGGAFGFNRIEFTVNFKDDINFKQCWFAYLSWSGYKNSAKVSCKTFALLLCKPWIIFNMLTIWLYHFQIVSIFDNSFWFLHCLPLHEVVIPLTFKTVLLTLQI